MNRRKTILIILLVVSRVCPGFAQDSGALLQCEPLYECFYRYDIHDEVQETYSTVLQIGKDFSRFYDYSAYAVDSLSHVAGASVEERNRLEEMRRTSMFYFDSEIWQNQPSDAMTVVMEVSPNLMGYTEELGSMNWNLEDGNETICGYVCNKATTSYGGRNWVVWYAPEIPSTAGPWKFNGLPGLILAAKDSESIHEFEAIAFRKGTTPVVKTENATVFQSTRDKVLKSKLSTEKDIKDGKWPGVEEVKYIGVYKTLDGNNIVYINGVARRPRPNGYQPLELE
jgi:GLPGLI family protein